MGAARLALPVGEFIALVTVREGCISGLWLTRGLPMDARLATAAERAERPLAELSAWLEQYFAGAAPGFTPPLAPEGSPFQRDVWAETAKIPFGTTVTYGELARRVAIRRGGRPCAQAVGQAMRANRILLLIPCHRVVAAGNRLGGYGGGEEIKRALLAHEGVTGLA